MDDGRYPQKSLSIDYCEPADIVRDSPSRTEHTQPLGDRRMGANHAGERKRRKLKNTKKILRTQLKKAQAKGK
jgi:hypothetical protein